MLGEMIRFGTKGGETHAADLAELIDRCAEFSVRGGSSGLSKELTQHANAVRSGYLDSIDRLDDLFAWNGPLHIAAMIDGWDEEYVGLAAAYRVETASLCN